MAEQSLFGVTPEALQASRDAALQAQALQYAKLDPFQRANMSIYQGAGQLGGAIGGMLGGQDPEMMRLKQRQSLMQGLDLTSADSLKQGIQAAMQSNDYALASELNARLQASAKAALEGRKTEAEIGAKLSEKSTPEMKNAAALAASSGAEIGTPAWTAAYNTNLERLTTAAGKGDTIKEVGVAAKTGEAVYTFQTPSGVQQVVFGVDPKTGKQVMIPYNGPVDRTTSKTDVGVKLPAGESEFVKKLGALDAVAVSDAMKSAASARSTLGALEKLNNLNNNELISGTFASGRVGATNLLNTLGLTSQADTARLATSENYQKVAGDVILQTLGGKLGAGFSNEDRKFIQGLVPQLENSAPARKQLIEFMAKKNREIITEATAMEKHARKYNGLAGYEPKIPFGAAPVGAAAMTTEQLRAEIQRLKGGQ